jgi:hypothetical protein
MKIGLPIPFNLEWELEPIFWGKNALKNDENHIRLEKLVVVWVSKK